MHRNPARTAGGLGSPKYQRHQPEKLCSIRLSRSTTRYLQEALNESILDSSRPLVPSLPACSRQAPLYLHRAMTWMQRLKQVFGIDIKTCERCGRKVKVMASIEAPADRPYSKTLATEGSLESRHSTARTPAPNDEAVRLTFPIDCRPLACRSWVRQPCFAVQAKTDENQPDPLQSHY